jgi:hypothetical protein
MQKLDIEKFVHMKDEAIHYNYICDLAEEVERAERQKIVEHQINIKEKFLKELENQRDRSQGKLI